MAVARTSGLKKGLRRVALAGIGAAALAKERAQEFAKRCTAKGEQMEPQIKKAIRKIAERRKLVAKKVGAAAGKAEGGMKRLWKQIPLVTKSDLADLGRRIDALAGRMETLTKTRKAR